VASSSVTPTYGEPNALAEELNPLLLPSRPTLPDFPNQGEFEVTASRIVLITIQAFLPLLWPPSLPMTAQRLLDVCLSTLPRLCPFS